MGPLGGGKDRGGGNASIARSEFEQYPKRLEQSRLSILDLTEAERARIAIVAGELGQPADRRAGTAASWVWPGPSTRCAAGPRSTRRSRYSAGSEIEATDATNAALAAAALSDYKDARASMRCSPNPGTGRRALRRNRHTKRIAPES